MQQARSRRCWKKYEPVGGVERCANVFSAPWVVEVMIPVVRENAVVRRYPVKEELGGVLGALLGVDESGEALVKEADTERLREAS